MAVSGQESSAEGTAAFRRQEGLLDSEREDRLCARRDPIHQGRRGHRHEHGNQTGKTPHFRFFNFRFLRFRCRSVLWLVRLLWNKAYCWNHSPEILIGNAKTETSTFCISFLCSVQLTCSGVGFLSRKEEDSYKNWLAIFALFAEKCAPDSWAQGLQHPQEYHASTAVLHLTEKFLDKFSSSNEKNNTPEHNPEDQSISLIT